MASREVRARRMSRRDDRAWATWCGQIDQAFDEIQELFWTRWMWRAIIGMLQHSDPPRSSHVNNYLLQTYVTTVCTAVRREADRDNRTTSLARCLTRLVDSPTLVTRTRYRELLAGLTQIDDPQTLADECFDRYAPDGAEVIDSALVLARLESLDQAVEPIKRYTDQVIAHRDGDVSETINFAQINHALGELGRTFHHYWTLRHPGQVRASVAPIMDFRFLETFSVPWYQEGFQPPDWRDPDDD